LMTAPQAPFIPPEKLGKPVVALLVCYAGDLAEGARVVAPLRQLATPIADVISPMPYPAMFALTEEATVRGLQHAVRSLFLRALSDEVIHAIVEGAAAIMSPMALVQVRVLGDAMSRVANDATAFAHRDKQALRPYASGVYVNFLGDEGEPRIREAYPPATYARLAALKRRYDPTNLFHLNQNIPPARTDLLAA
jgi:hypothetical protein